ADDVQAEIAALRRRRADLLGDDTPEDLDRRRRELADRIAAEPDGSRTEAPAPAPDSATEDDPVEEASEAERKLAGLRAADREPAAAAAVAAPVEESTSVLEAAQEAARSARDRLQEALADAPPELLENAKSSLASLAAEERDSAAVVATALGRVNWIGGQGRIDEFSSAER